jgi:hypothetical protein
MEASPDFKPKHTKRTENEEEMERIIEVKKSMP